MYQSLVQKRRSKIDEIKHTPEYGVLQEQVFSCIDRIESLASFGSDEDFKEEEFISRLLPVYEGIKENLTYIESAIADYNISRRNRE